ncbi:uncharacterized protein LOC128274164 [Anopheles cruzii]|uniref:uncharacterized protein LOC128274164 n=1 Tax=Anopheles cruzii TaxID=68878 RepID=UPI0022EC6A9C|nr:uncharacterized protein LOC128274164 [Anopheles cruzii]
MSILPNNMIADFDRNIDKLRTASAQDEAVLKRKETLFNQLKSCLAQFSTEQVTAKMLQENNQELECQIRSASEELEALETKCSRLALEQLRLSSPDSDKVANPKAPTAVVCAENSSADTERQVFDKIVRRYCNLYLQFDGLSNVIRVLSIQNNSFFEVALNSKPNDNSLQEQVWARLGATSHHLKSWESLL